MKKLLVLVLSVLMICSLLGISASAAVITSDADYIVEVEYDTDGFIFMTYEFPERPEIPPGPYQTDLLWVDIWVFEAGTEPATGAELAEMFYQGPNGPVGANKLLKTPGDDQFLATERWIGPSFDEGADSEFVFESGKTYNIYFGCCDGATWYYFTNPYVFEYEGESGTPVEPTETATQEVTQTPSENVTQAPTEKVTQAPSEEVTQAPSEEVTQAPSEEVTQAPTEEVTQAPTEEVTQAPSEEATQAVTGEATEVPGEQATESAGDTAGDNTLIIIIAAAVVVVIAAVVIILIAKKKKKAE